MNTPASHLSPQSRVWVYQTNRELTDTEITEIQKALDAFTRQWVSHNRQLKADSKIYHRRFIVLMVDETQAGASGCSIDASVHFLQGLQQKYQLDLFDRLQFAFREGEQIQVLGKDAFQEWYRSGRISDKTVVFNNLVKTLEELEKNWQIPLKDSWHKQFV